MREEIIDHVMWTEKRGKRQSVFGLTYDLRYFFDDSPFYMLSSQYFGHVNGEKQPGQEDSFERACVFLKWLKVVLILFSAFGSILEAEILNGN